LEYASQRKKIVPKNQNKMNVVNLNDKVNIFKFFSKVASLLLKLSSMLGKIKQASTAKCRASMAFPHWSSPWNHTPVFTKDVL
jgi:hypothetical protein